MAFQIKGEDKITYDNLNNNVTTLMQPKNWIINGGFDVWQRGTSQTTSGYGSDDRWNNAHNISTKTHSRQAFTIGQTDVPNNPTYFSRTIATSSASASSYVIKQHWIEDVTKFSLKTITLSFWAKADANKNIAIEFRQYFGLGGSSMVDAIGVQKVALTSAWQKVTKTVLIPSVLGKTIGTGSSLVAQIWFDAGSDYNTRTNSLGNQSGTFDIANVSLVEGSVPVEWQTEAYADVLRQCQRYYVRYGGLNVNEVFSNVGTTFDSTHAEVCLVLPVQMRIVPSSIEYNSLYVLTAGVGWASISSLTLGSQTSGNKSIYLSAISSGLTSPRTVFITSNTSSGYLGISAEL